MLMYKVMYINIFHCFYFVANKINNYLLYFIYIPIANLYRHRYPHLSHKSYDCYNH